MIKALESELSRAFVYSLVEPFYNGSIFVSAL